MNRKVKTTEYIEFSLTNLDKLSLNKFNTQHFIVKSKWKNAFKELVREQTNNLKLDGGYELDFNFFFSGRKLDKINVAHYCKTCEDTIFTEDKDNGTVSMNTNQIPKKDIDDRGNYVNIILTKEKEVSDEVN